MLNWAERPCVQLSILYGPADANVVRPFGSIASPCGIAAKNGIVIRPRKSAAGFTSVICSVLAFLTTTPDAVGAFPAATSAAPTTSVMNCTAGDCICGLRSRLIASAKLCAVTDSPVLNLQPPAFGLIVNV